MFLVVHMLKIMPTLTAVYLSGEWGRRLTSFVIAVYCFGTCITFLVIIGELIGERSPKSVRRRGGAYCSAGYQATHRSISWANKSFRKFDDFWMGQRKSIRPLSFIGTAFGLFSPNFCLYSMIRVLPTISIQTCSPEGAWKCNFPSSLVIMTHRVVGNQELTKKPTDEQRGS